MDEVQLLQKKLESQHTEMKKLVSPAVYKKVNQLVNTEIELEEYCNN